MTPARLRRPQPARPRWPARWLPALLRARRFRLGPARCCHAQRPAFRQRNAGWRNIRSGAGRRSGVRRRTRMSLRGQGQRNELRLSDYPVAGKQGNVMHGAGRRNDLVGRVGAEIEADAGPCNADINGPDVQSGECATTSRSSRSISSRPSWTSFASSHRTMAEIDQPFRSSKAFSAGRSPPESAKTRIWVSRFSTDFSFESRAEDIAPNFHLVAEAADEFGMPPLIGKQVCDRFSTLGDGQAVIAEVVQQGPPSRKTPPLPVPCSGPSSSAQGGPPTVSGRRSPTPGSRPPVSATCRKRRCTSAHAGRSPDPART